MSEWWEEEDKTVTAAEAMGLMNSTEAMKYLRMSQPTLDRIEREGGLVPLRTRGGHRRYNLRMLNQYLENSRGPRGKR